MLGIGKSRHRIPQTQEKGRDGLERVCYNLRYNGGIMTDDHKPKGVSDAQPARFEAEAAKSGLSLKVRKIGNSLGVVLPKEVLAKLRVGEGDQLSVSETKDGVALSPFNDEVANQVEVMRDIAKRYRNALRELAK